MNNNYFKQGKPFIIAEMSGNHDQSLDKAIDIVKKAAEAGVHAIKLQTYTADTMTIDSPNSEFFISDPNSLWTGNSLYDLYKKASTPLEWHQPLFQLANELGLKAFSSPFDSSAVDFLEDLNVPFYKIASFENIDLPLIKKVSSTGKPVIISTGMASIAELDEAVTAARDSGCKELVLLKCTSTYPATPENSNLLTIPHLRQLFNCEVGLSDHTLGIGVAIASVALGATVIEKHFTLDRNDGAVDSKFSLEPAEMKNLVMEVKNAVKSLGCIKYGPTESEINSLKHRRSLYIVENMKAGEVLNSDNLKAIRPGLGLAPKYYDIIIGKKLSKDAVKGTPVSWELMD